MSTRNPLSYSDRQRALVTCYNGTPYDPLAARDINPQRDTLTNANPHFDAAQRTFERNDAARIAPGATYASKVRGLAFAYADKAIRRSRLPVSHLRNEFADEAEGAINFFLGVRLARFPVLAERLLFAFAMDGLPETTRRNLARSALRACDARLSRLARATADVTPTFFDTLPDGNGPDERTDEERASDAEAKVRARFAYLRARLAERTGASGNAKRAARAHSELLDVAQAYFLGAVHGHAVALPKAGLKRERETIATSRAYWFGRDNVMAYFSRAEKAESGAQVLTARALYYRLSRLADFLGDSTIAGALSRHARTR